MEKKQQKEHGVEIKISAIPPLELWRKLGLEQKSESMLMNPQKFDNEESKMAYEAFKNDFRGENQIEQGVVISSEKGGIFLLSLLKAQSKRVPKEKISSKKFLFKDKLFQGICKKAKGIKFSEKDFEDIILYLERKRLVYTLGDGIRMTHHLTDLLHQKYKAWLVFK